MSDTYEQGAADAFALIMRAIQETLPAPHNDPAEPSPEVLQSEEVLLDVFRAVASRKLTLFDPADFTVPELEQQARERATEVMGRHRRLARAILELHVGDEEFDG